MFRFIFLFILTTTSFHVSADSFDVELDEYIKRFQFQAVDKPTGKNKALYKLGEKLFHEKLVSGNKNISCSSCHAVENFSTDLLPLSIGVNGSHRGLESSTNHIAPIIPRHSPHLFNLGEKENTFMFWDGRVSFGPRDHVFFTPEEGLNGSNPKFQNITKALKSALAAQALFPPLSFAEMRGSNNEIADAKSNIEAWRVIMKRLFNIKLYAELFKKSYPNLSTADFNIGHFGEAIAHFIKFKFTVNDTPWDKYLKGDKSALSIDEKKGAIAFVKRGLCATCHSGKLLGGDSFHNVVSPQIGPGKTKEHDDLGLYAVTQNPRTKYKFKTPSLRNTALTPPYFHSGALKTLEDVVTHYEGGMNSLDKYDPTWLKSFEDKNYLKTLYVEKDPNLLFEKKKTVHGVLRRNFITFNATERKNLLLFLKKSLTSKSFLTKN